MHMPVRLKTHAKHKEHILIQYSIPQFSGFATVLRKLLVEGPRESAEPIKKGPRKAKDRVCAAEGVVAVCIHGQGRPHRPNVPLMASQAGSGVQD